ncbi:DUF6000 family protein [Anatilimnocola sp. NA78]|uniref:DUF6000 family protein n=1 Tax=Anatilimnocola sp. NA78 TaxID=3415683 RepID=UPI003CE4F824
MDKLSDNRARWVSPLYANLLHGNFSRQLLATEVSVEREQMLAEFRRCVAEVAPAVVATLLSEREWRGRLTASWYAGLRGWTQFRDELGRLLCRSEMCFAGQGYCAALACFADEESAAHLCAYLDRWLPKIDCYYDQHWALPALVWIDQRLRANFAARYLEPEGLWDQWALAHGQPGAKFYIESQRAFDLTLSSALASFRGV